MPTSPLPQSELDSRAWLEQATREARLDWAKARRSAGPSEQAQALACLSGYVYELEGPVPALRLSRRAHELWKVSGDPGLIAVSSAVLAVRLLDAGRPEEAIRQAMEALEDFRQLPIQLRHPGVLRSIGKELLLAGYASEAQAWLELALKTPAEGERANILAHLSRAMDLQGRLLEAQEHQYEACVAYHLQDEPIAMAKAMVTLARLNHRAGQPWAAATLCQEADRILVKFRCPQEAAEARELRRLCRGTPRGPISIQRLGIPAINRPSRN